MTDPPRRNQRLRAAMRAAGISYAELAQSVGRHTKSVQRWVYDGRVPHNPATRRRVAEILDVAESSLWPTERVHVVVGRTTEVCPDRDGVVIHAGALELILIPRSGGEPLTVRDVTVWRDLAGACADMAGQIAREWAAQTMQPTTNTEGA